MRLVIAALLLVTLAFARNASGAGLPELQIPDDSRIMIIVPHPDDEILGCAGVIQTAVAKKLPLRIVFLTYGDSNQWSFIAYNGKPTIMPKGARAMGSVRRREAIAAADTLGVPKESLVFLGYPDYGTMVMWRAKWGDHRPYRGRLTGARHVPYESAFHPGADYKPENVVGDLTSLIGDFRPTHIFVSHPADRHPDHASLYLYTRLALLDLHLTPKVYPFLVHYPGWPLSRGFKPERPFAPPEELASEESWVQLPLTDTKVSQKKAALQQHRSQYEYSATRLLAFVRDLEIFGDIPTYRIETAADMPDVRGGSQPYLFQNAPADVESEARSGYVDIENARVGREESILQVRIRVSRPVPETAQLSVYLFGYRDDVPFAKMPKIEVRTSEQFVFVYDNGHRARGAKVNATLNPLELDLRVPLGLLGRPQQIFFGGRTWSAAIDTDVLPWRLIDLR